MEACGLREGGKVVTWLWQHNVTTISYIPIDPVLSVDLRGCLVLLMKCLCYPLPHFFFLYFLSTRPPPNFLIGLHPSFSGPQIHSVEVPHQSQ